MNDQKITVSEYLAFMREKLFAGPFAAEQTPKIDAQFLVCHHLNCSRASLLARPESLLTQTQMTNLNNSLYQRLQGYPIAYITGKKSFWSLQLATNPSTLIPRPETELLIEIILRDFDDQERSILDLGTGTGAIAIALAKERPCWQMTGIDLEDAIISLAQQNAKRENIHTITWKKSDWFSALNGQKFDVIVSNPPYIKDGDPHLKQGDVRFEPTSALLGGIDGLNHFRHILQHAKNYLYPCGRVICEHGYDQSDSVQAIFRKYGFKKIHTYQDYAGHNRATAGCI